MFTYSYSFSFQRVFVAGFHQQRNSKLDAGAAPLKLLGTTRENCRGLHLFIIPSPPACDK